MFALQTRPTAPRWPALAAAVGSVGVGFWLARRAVRAADGYAADGSRTPRR